MKLFPYQVKASSFIQRNPRCILRLDTGLGKTAVCIDAVKKIPGVKNVLVIAPAFLRENWIREIKLWSGESKGRFGERVSWTIVSYGKLARKGHLDKVLKEKWDLIICDEAHYLKNWEAKRTRNIVLELLPKCDRVVLSTATPFVRSAADLHPLFSTCEPGKWGKLKDFQEKYCLKKPNIWKRWKRFDYYGANKETVGELKVASSRFMISKKKKDVLKDLPEKLETDLEIRLPKRYALSEMEFEEYIDVDTGEVKGGLHRELSIKMRELGLAKLEVAKEWIENFNAEEPLVIFCKHLEVQDHICKNLERSYHKINGGIGTVLRDKYVTEFQKGNVKTLVATMASCGVGVNLTAASYCLFVELPWSAAELKQCEDRLHRIGQRNCVQVYRLIGRDTLDSMVCGILNRKIDGEHLSIGSM